MRKHSQQISLCHHVNHLIFCTYTYSWYINTLRKLFCIIILPRIWKHIKNLGIINLKYPPRFNILKSITSHGFIVHQSLSECKLDCRLTEPDHTI